VIRLIWDEGFKRRYKKKVKNDEKLKMEFWEFLEVFTENPFTPQLRTHKLSGKLKGLWAFSASYDCRVVFEFLGKEKVLLVDIGDHDEVY